MLECTGLLLPVPTPLTDDGRAVSEVRTARMMRGLIERGETRFLVCGESGEFFSLTIGERKSMLEWAAREAKNGMTVVPNVSALSTNDSVDLARHAGQQGAKAVLLTAPFSGHYTAAEVAQHFKTIASFCPVPVLIAVNRLAVQESAFDAVRDIPHVQFVEGKHWDNWMNGPYGCQAAASYSSLLGVDRLLIEKLIQTYGSAPAAKACLESLGLETGALRSPKMEIPPEVFNKMIPSAA